MSEDVEVETTMQPSAELERRREQLRKKAARLEQAKVRTSCPSQQYRRTIPVALRFPRSAMSLSLSAVEEDDSCIAKIP